MGMVTDVIDSVFGAVGLVMDTNANRSAQEVNARELNRAAASEAAAGTDALTRGAHEVGMARQRGTSVLGQQRVAFAANNVDASSGTAAQLQAATSYATAQDATTIRANALAEALGHQQTAEKYITERKRQANAVDSAYEASYLALAGKTIAAAAGGAAGGGFGGK